MKRMHMGSITEQISLISSGLFCLPPAFSTHNFPVREFQSFENCVTQIMHSARKYAVCREVLYCAPLYSGASCSTESKQEHFAFMFVYA